MEWPISGNGARLLKVCSDASAGELTVTAVFDNENEQDIVYEGMFYQQFAENAENLVIDSVTKVALEELEYPEYAHAMARLYDDCGANEQFIWDMYSRESRIFAHRARDGSVYLVLAKHLRYGESRPCRGGKPPPDYCFGN